MKTIKIIDLINRCMEHDITLPEKIIYKYEYFERVDTDAKKHFYYQSMSTCNNFLSFINYFTDLTDEVEVIGEEIITPEVKEIEKVKNRRFTKNQKQIAGKINELIDAVNELRKENK